MIVILVGMAIAFAVAVYRLSPDLSFHGRAIRRRQNGQTRGGRFLGRSAQALHVLVGPDWRLFSRAFLFRSGPIAGATISRGGSLKESRLGLLFNAVVKVPMQFFILLLGAIVFMFYQFEKPPVYFNQPAYQRAVESGYAPQLAALQTQFDDVFAQKRAAIRAVSSASSKLSSNERDAAMTRLRELDAQARELRDRTKAVLEQAGADPKSKDSDYVFITFILQQMPHGVVGLLIAVILCATMSATAAISECARFHHGDRFLSAVDSPERERPSLCRRGESADSGVGFDRHRSRFVCQFGRKSDRSR